MISWLDIPVLNLTRAEAFYAQVFNVTCQRQPSDVPSSLLIDDQRLCKICLIQHVQLQPNAQGQVIYLQPNQPLKAASALVEQFGGKVLEGITIIGHFGQRQIILDSEGNKIALFESLPTR